MSRIRQIKPSWFLDKTLWTRCKAETREFYQALWMIADDDGWFEWDTATIGAEVYCFVPVGRRERDVERHRDILLGLQVDDPHLIVHECGHAQVPKMPQHQRVSDSKRVTTEHRRHLSHCLPRIAADSRGEPRTAADLPHGKEQVGNGKERNGTVGAQARNDDGRPSEFRQRVPRPAVGTMSGGES